MGVSEFSGRLAVTLGVCLFAMGVAAGAPGATAPSASGTAPKTPATLPAIVDVAEVARIRAMIVARLGALSNLAAEYVEVRNYTPAKEAIKPVLPGDAPERPSGEGGAGREGALGGVMEGTYTYHVEYSFLQGKERRLTFNTKTDPATIRKIDAAGITGPQQFREAFRPEDVETYDARPDRAPRVEVSPKGAILVDMRLDVALGLRLPVKDVVGNTWMDAKRVEGLTFSRDGDLTVATLPAPEGGTIAWTINTRMAGTVVKCLVTSADGVKTLEIAASDYKQFQGVTLPQGARMTEGTTLADGKYQVTRTTTWRVSRYVLNDPGNVPDRYHVYCDEGTIVRAPGKSPPLMILENGAFRSLSEKELAGIEALERALAARRGR